MRSFTNIHVSIGNGLMYDSNMSYKAHVNVEKIHTFESHR